MRGYARKQARNHSAKARLHTLEKNYLALVTTGKKEEATKALRDVSSAFDKAAKQGTVHRSTADRKKSRLSMRLAKAA